MRKFKENELLEFLINTYTVKGTYIRTTGKRQSTCIVIKVTESDYSWEKIGSEASINLIYLINKK